MDYEKKYNESIVKLRKLFDSAENNGETLGLWFNDFVNIFPELKESEDEKIRKALVDTFKFYDPPMNSPYLLGIDKKDVLTWLEKQGEKIDIANKEYWRGYREGKKEILDKYSELEKQNEQKSARPILTWKDIAHIIDIREALLYKSNVLYDTKEEFCEKILKRYKEQKENNI